jgi:hypothetical protein
MPLCRMQTDVNAMLELTSPEWGSGRQHEKMRPHQRPHEPKPSFPPSLGEQKNINRADATHDPCGCS